jgi:hypothetical protein
VFTFKRAIGIRPDNVLQDAEGPLGITALLRISAMATDILNAYLLDHAVCRHASVQSLRQTRVRSIAKRQVLGTFQAGVLYGAA